MDDEDEKVTKATARAVCGVTEHATARPRLRDAKTSSAPHTPLEAELHASFEVGTTQSGYHSVIGFVKQAKIFNEIPLTLEINATEHAPLPLKIPRADPEPKFLRKHNGPFLSDEEDSDSASAKDQGPEKKQPGSKRPTRRDELSPQNITSHSKRKRSSSISSASTDKLSSRLGSDSQTDNIRAHHNLTASSSTNRQTSTTNSSPALAQAASPSEIPASEKTNTRKQKWRRAEERMASEIATEIMRDLI